MQNKVALILVNYNMPEYADKLYEYVTEHTDWPLDFILVDNASDLVEPSEHTTVRLEENIQTTGGWLMGMSYSDYLVANRGTEPYFAYWVMSTSIDFFDGLDPLTPLVELLLENPKAIGVSAAMVSDAPDEKAGANTQMRPRGDGKENYQTCDLDNVATLWRADWLNSIGRFDLNLFMAHGIPVETGWLARKDGRELWIHQGVRIRKLANIGYRKGRMNMTREERIRIAYANKAEVLSEKYGEGWLVKLRDEYTDLCQHHKDQK